MTYVFYKVLILILCILLSPLMVAIAVVLACSSGFPVLFRQRRVGKGGKAFTMYKFRTMQKNAEQERRSLARMNQADGPVFKIRMDPRFTTVGMVLSHTGLDELPQLWNVLKGDMALIGPRPLPQAEAKRLKPWMRARETILPGIISPAVLSGTYHKDFTLWMKRDVSYVREKSVATDLRLFGRAFIFLSWLAIQEVKRVVGIG